MAGGIHHKSWSTNRSKEMNAEEVIPSYSCFERRGGPHFIQMKTNSFFAEAFGGNPKHIYEALIRRPFFPSTCYFACLLAQPTPALFF